MKRVVEDAETGWRTATAPTLTTYNYCPNNGVHLHALRTRAVCFDLDGVLLDTMHLHARAWQEALKPIGLIVRRQSIYESEGESGIATAERLLGQEERAYGLPAALLREKEKRFQRLALHVSVKPMLQRMLDRLLSRGIRLALVTGTSSREIQRVLPHNVLCRFEAVVTGDRVQKGKPHPEPYRRALRKLHIVPREAIVVENAPYGIQSARAAGAGLVIALASSLPPRFLQEAHIIVASVKQLCAVLERATQVDK